MKSSKVRSLIRQADTVAAYTAAGGPLVVITKRAAVDWLANAEFHAYCGQSQPRTETAVNAIGMFCIGMTEPLGEPLEVDDPRLTGERPKLSDRRREAFVKTNDVDGGSLKRVVRARWFERGWERAIDARAPQWEQLSQSKREKLTNRWSLAAANEIVASGDNIPPRSNDPSSATSHTKHHEQPTDLRLLWGRVRSRQPNPDGQHRLP